MKITCVKWTKTPPWTCQLPKTLTNEFGPNTHVSHRHKS